MANMALGALLKAAGDFELISGSLKTRVAGVTDSTRSVKKGFAFVCVKGINSDGHAFAAEAVKKGAAAVIVQDVEAVDVQGAALVKTPDSKEALYALLDRWYAPQKRKMSFYGVTGTKGKTTVTYLADALLKQRFKRENTVIGTVGYKIGRRKIEAANTTPSNSALHEMAGQSEKAGVKNFIMEASSHALDQGRVRNIMFDAAAVTNITRDHLDYHGSYKKYFEAKMIILRNIKKGGFLAVNADEHHAPKILKLARTAKVKTVTFGIRKKADIMALEAVSGVHGLECVLSVFGKKQGIKCHLVGWHNLENILAAAALVHKKVALKDIAAALAKFGTVPGRLERAYGGEFTVLVDFAHTPDAIERVLLAVRKIAKGRIISLFGAGGDRDRGKRPLMGHAAEKHSDIIIVTSDNPRSEEPKAIIKEILKGIRDKKNVTVEPDRAKAIRLAIKMAKPGDVVMLMGKGHETYQIVKGKKYHFNDKEEVIKAMRSSECGIKAENNSYTACNTPHDKNREI